MELGTIGAEELDLTQEPKAEETSTIGAIMDAAAYGTNIAYTAYENLTNPVLQDPTESGEYKGIDWTSTEVQDILKPLTPEERADISSSIYSIPQLKAVMARRQKEQDDNVLLQRELGEGGAMALQLATGLVDVDVLTGAAILKTATLSSKLYKASTATKVAMGAGVGATDAVVSDALLQGAQGTDNTEQRLYTAAFGGTLGGFLGKYTFQQDPNLQGNKTLTDRVAEDLDPVITEKRMTNNSTAKLVVGDKLTISPSATLHNSDDVIQQDFANKMVGSPTAKVDAEGKLVVNNQASAENIKAEVQDTWTKTQRETDLIFGEAKEKGYTGSRKDFESAVHSEILTSHATRQREALKGSKEAMKKEELEILRAPDRPKYKDGRPKKLTKAERDALYTKHVTKKLENVDYTFKHNNPIMNKAMTNVGNYFTKMGERLQTSKVMENIQNSGFFPREFDINKMTKAPEAFKTKLAEALGKHPANYGQGEKALKNAVNEIYERILAKAHKRAEGVDADTARVKSHRARKIEYYDDDMLEFLQDNISEVGVRYSRDMSGRIALQETLGYHTKKDFNTEMAKIGTSHVKEMEVVFDTISGTRIPRGSMLPRIAMKTARLMASPGFVLASIPELALPIVRGGFKAVINDMYPALTTSLQLMRGKKLTNKVHNELNSFMIAGDIVNAKQFNRMDNDETIYSTLGNGFGAKVENWLDAQNHGIYKYGGLGFVTEVTETIALTTGSNWLVRMAKETTHSAADSNALARMGFNTDTLASINNEITKGNIKFDNKGNIVEFGFENWDTKTVQSVKYGLNKHLRDTVLRPDGTNLPMWITKDSETAQLLTQFLHYPVAMYEKLALQGWSEKSINTAVAMTTSFGLAMAVSQIRDIGKEEPRYDLTTDEGMAKALAYSISNNYMTGLPYLILDKAATSANHSLTSVGGDALGIDMGSSYNPGASGLLGPAFGVGDRITQSLGHAVEGDFGKAASRMPTPLDTVPIIGNYFKALKETLKEN